MAAEPRLSDLARRLAESAIGVYCDACTGSPESGHFPDCPMLLLPRLVAVVEASERVAGCLRLAPHKYPRLDVNEAVDAVVELARALDTARDRAAIGEGQEA